MAFLLLYYGRNLAKMAFLLLETELMAFVLQDYASFSLLKQANPVKLVNQATLETRNSALWVKSGNRGNLKCLRVNNHLALIFHRKMFISLLSDAKLPKVYD